MAKSEVARFREQQALEEQSAYLGMYGLAAGSARHDFIVKRAEQGAKRILQLLADGKQEEARLLMDSPTWGEDMSHYDTRA